MAGENYDYGGSPRLGLGEIALADFDETYEIERFPRQADQPNIVDWLPPLDGSDVYSEFIENVRGFDGSSGTWGAGSFDWYTGYWTPLMCRYFTDTFLANGAGSARVTVMTFDRAYGYRVLWATMIRPDFRNAEPVGEGYSRIRIEFIEATEAA